MWLVREGSGKAQCLCTHTYMYPKGVSVFKNCENPADKKGYDVELGEYGGLKRQSLLPVQRQLSGNLLQYFLLF